MAVPASDVEIVGDDDDDDGDPSSTLSVHPPVMSGSEALQANATSPATTSASAAPEHASMPLPKRTYVDDVTSGRIRSIDPAAPKLQLPANGAALVAAGGIEPYVAECYALLRHDFPLLALSRLLLVAKLADEAAIKPPLRERTDDQRIVDVLRTERELGPALAMITDEEGWELVASQKKLSVNTYLRMLGSGRAAIKVQGVLPHGILPTVAPLLHTELFSKWIPGIGKAAELRRPSNFRRLIYLRTWAVPIPFLATRDAVATGYGDVYSSTSCIVYLTDNELLENEGIETDEERAVLHKYAAHPLSCPHAAFRLCPLCSATSHFLHDTALPLTTLALRRAPFHITGSRRLARTCGSRYRAGSASTS